MSLFLFEKQSMEARNLPLLYTIDELPGDAPSEAHIETVLLRVQLRQKEKQLKESAQTRQMLWQKLVELGDANIKLTRENEQLYKKLDEWQTKALDEMQKQRYKLSTVQEEKEELQEELEDNE